MLGGAAIGAATAGKDKKKGALKGALFGLTLGGASHIPAMLGAKGAAATTTTGGKLASSKALTGAIKNASVPVYEASATGGTKALIGGPGSAKAAAAQQGVLNKIATESLAGGVYTPTAAEIGSFAGKEGLAAKEALLANNKAVFEAATTGAGGGGQAVTADMFNTSLRAGADKAAIAEKGTIQALNAHNKAVFEAATTGVEGPAQAFTRNMFEAPLVDAEIAKQGTLGAKLKAGSGKILETVKNKPLESAMMMSMLGGGGGGGGYAVSGGGGPTYGGQQQVQPYAPAEDRLIAAGGKSDGTPEFIPKGNFEVSQAMKEEEYMRMMNRGMI